MQKTLSIIIGIVILGLGGWFLFASSGIGTQTGNEMSSTDQTQGATKTFNVQLVNRVLSSDIVTVTEGDMVTIHVTTDETGEFHISGYEIENDMTDGEPLEFSFTADQAGRYNFELHPKAAMEINASEEPAEGEAGEDIVIGAFVVNPR